MKRLYVLAARQRKLLFKAEQEWNLYESALILRVDVDQGTADTCLEYHSPREVRASDELYDIPKNRRLREIDLEPYGMNIVFSIFPAFNY